MIKVNGIKKYRLAVLTVVMGMYSTAEGIPSITLYWCQMRTRLTGYFISYISV